jgi:hypothetical protein
MYAYIYTRPERLNNISTILRQSLSLSIVLHGIRAKSLEFKTRLMQYKIKILQSTFGPCLVLRKPHVRGSVEV